MMKTPLTTLMSLLYVYINLEINQLHFLVQLVQCASNKIFQIILDASPGIGQELIAIVSKILIKGYPVEKSVNEYAQEFSLAEVLTETNRKAIQDKFERACKISSFVERYCLVVTEVLCSCPPVVLHNRQGRRGCSFDYFALLCAVYQRVECEAAWGSLC